MATSIQEVVPREKQNYQYTLIELRNVDYEQLLASDVPEAIVLAILANFKGHSAEVLIRQIVKSLQRCAKSATLLEKYLRQLNHFSGLRTLDIEIKQIVEAMPIDYDYTQHILYKDGKQDTKEEVIVNMLNRNFSIPEIALIVNTSEAFVLEVKQKHKL